ncbi:hypothetical protein [Mycolicibacterium porcinum]|uniref:Uncharacterized protein n=1 Tax=Mycolicibacterium porcinum TaxID=39693 RepID=A0AAW5SW58_9MYCO|nr:hypothetical protein [Mycolicibacterium porcinum]MCV7386844.1 hypothetical protein [Mycolicibacterium porcinum]CDO28878.1 hypothetical protein BN979_01664 [Mycolicibacterium vulneris]
MFTSSDMQPRRKAWGIITALLLIAALMMQLVSPAPAWIGGERGFGAALSWAEPWPPGPGPGPGPGPDFGSGGGSQFQPPSMPSIDGGYSGGSYPAPPQSNGIDINNPASQMPAGEQGSEPQYPYQQTRPQPVHGQQPPNYDLAPQQQPAQEPAQQPQQQPAQQQPQQREQQQVDEQPQNSENEQQRNNDCSPNTLIPPKADFTDADEAAAFLAFAKAARQDSTYKAMEASSPDHKDHVIPLRRLWGIPGFKNLDLATQVRIANLPDNLKPLFGRWNMSKQDRLASEWVPTDRVNPKPSAEDMTAMCADEQAATQAVLREIQQATANQASEVLQRSIPKQTNIDPPQAPANDPAENAPQQQPAPQTSVAPPNQPPSSPTQPEPPSKPPVRRPPSSSPPSSPPASPPAQEPVKEPSPQLPGWVEPVGVGVLFVAGVAACVFLCAPAVAAIVAIAGIGAIGAAAAG